MVSLLYKSGESLHVAHVRPSPPPSSSSSQAGTAASKSLGPIIVDADQIPKDEQDDRKHFIWENE